MSKCMILKAVRLQMLKDLQQDVKCCCKLDSSFNAELAWYDATLKRPRAREFISGPWPLQRKRGS